MEKLDLRLRPTRVRAIESPAFPLHLRQARARRQGGLERLRVAIQRRLTANLQVVDNQSSRRIKEEYTSKVSS